MFVSPFNFQISTEWCPFSRTTSVHPVGGGAHDAPKIQNSDGRGDHRSSAVTARLFLRRNVRRGNDQLTEGVCPHSVI